MTWQNQQNECAPSEVSDQPGHPPSLIRVFAVRMKKVWVLSYPLNAQRGLWSDWADAQADQSLRWAHSHFVGFVMSRLIYQSYEKKNCSSFNNVQSVVTRAPKTTVVGWGTAGKMCRAMTFWSSAQCWGYDFLQREGWGDRGQTTGQWLSAYPCSAF